MMASSPEAAAVGRSNDLIRALFNSLRVILFNDGPTTIYRSGFVYDCYYSNYCVVGVLA